MEDDLHEIFPEWHENIPVNELLDNVIDEIEKQGRRIVSFDEKNKKLMIFCPTPEALSDIWSNCDVINRALECILKANDPFMAMFEAKSLKTRFYMAGPELLKYKRFLLGKTDLDDDDEEAESGEEELWFWTNLRNSINAISAINKMKKN